MRKGVLVGNGSLRSEKFEELYRLLETAAAERGAELTLVRNTELVLPVGGRTPAAREGTAKDGGQGPSAPGESCGDARGERPPAHGEQSPFAEGAAAASRGCRGGTERRTSPGDPLGPEARPAPRRGLLFGAGTFGGMTLFGGAVSGLPGQRSAREMGRLLGGRRGPGLSWEEEPGREEAVRSARPAPDGAEAYAASEGTAGPPPLASPGTAAPGEPLPEQLRGAEFVLFWDKDVLLARAIERAGLRIYNSARAIELCDDKRLTHEALSAAGIPMPRTVMGPLVFGPCDFVPFARGVEALFAYPVVVKEAFGSFGAQVYLAKSREELVALCGSIAPRPFLVSEFVGESAGRDLRLQVVGGRVVAAMERRGREGDFRAGLTSGGSMLPFTPDREAETLALRAAQALGCDFAGVDLLPGPNGPLICEVNSNAHFKNLFDLTGVNAAEPILDLVLGRSV